MLPFHHIAIRPNNQVYPCCQFRHEHVPKDLNLNHPDVFNHPFLIELREMMVDDIQHPGCEQCYIQEKFSDGENSMRLDFLKKIGEQIPDKPLLTHVDLAMSNVCNNRCRMCTPELSTSWYADAKKLGIDIQESLNLSSIKRSNNFLEQYDLKELKYLKLIGGEPLAEQESFIKILNQCDLPKLRVMLATNCTLIPNFELVELLKKSKHISINLSVDAYGNLNNFLRKGSQWENVLNVMDWFVENFPGKIKIHSIVSIYNINNFYELSFFVKKRYDNLVFVEHQMVDGPDWMQPANLPEGAKKIILKNLENKLQDHSDFLPLIKNEFMRPGKLNRFFLKDQELNSIRNEHWKNLNPELYQMIELFKTN